MHKVFQRWFAAPNFPEDEEKTRRAYILNLILPFFVLAAFINMAIDLSSGILYTTPPLGVVIVVFLFAFYMNRKGLVTVAGIFVLLIILIALTLGLVQGHGVHDVGILIYPLIIVLASLILERSSLVVFTMLCLLAVLLLVWLEINGITHHNLSEVATDWGDFWIIALIFSLISFVIRIFGDQLRATLTRIRQNEQTLSLQSVELQAAEARWRSLVENAPDLILTVDRSGRVLFSNQRWLQSVDNLTGRSIFDFIPIDDHEKVLALIQEVINHNRPTSYEGLVIMNPTDNPTATLRMAWYSVRVGPIRREGGVQHAVLFATNVDAQKRAQDEIRQLNEDLENRVQQRTAELQAVIQELEAFTYSVSHDLRAPLRAIKGYTQFFGEATQDQLGDDQIDLFHRIQQSADRMDDLIKGLLALSRVGRQTLQISSCRLEDLVNDILAELLDGVDLNQVEVSVGDLGVIPADASLLRQVFANLISNALKYTRHRPHAVIEVGCQQMDNQTTYFVKDNGVGFDMQYSSGLFAPFQRLHAEEEYEGFGIGLTIVQRIIQRHGGKVWAEATLDQGATFYFTLGK